MINCKVNCLICNKELKNLSTNDNQPLNGMEFRTKGHYGSSVFDPMDDSSLIINICDECLSNAVKEGQVLRSQRIKEIRYEYKLEKYRG